MFSTLWFQLLLSPTFFDFRWRFVMPGLGCWVKTRVDGLASTPSHLYYNIILLSMIFGDQLNRIALFDSQSFVSSLEFVILCWFEWQLNFLHSSSMPQKHYGLVYYSFVEFLGIEIRFCCIILVPVVWYLSVFFKQFTTGTPPLSVSVLSGFVGSTSAAFWSHRWTIDLLHNRMHKK